MLETSRTSKTAPAQELPIGTRALTQVEQADRLLRCLSPEDVAEMTPEQLSDLAYFTEWQSHILIGS